MTEHRGASILVVDDEPAVRQLAVRVLEEGGFRCNEAGSALEALDRLAESRPDIVVTDVSLPGASGITLVNALSPLQPDVASVVITGSNDPDVGYRALGAGAFGYVQKPFNPNELLVAVNGALHRRRLELGDRADRARLTAELEESRLDVVERLARTVESRDCGTAEHVDRMSTLACSIARRLGWNDADAEMLRVASVLHDVGKVGIPDSVLLKRGRLTAGERERIEQHCEIGRAILAGAKGELLQLAETIAWMHHERIDGSGYPRGLAGDAIPLSARIAAVADVYDALSSARPYRRAFGREETLELIRGDAGFDPAVVSALERVVRA